MKKLACYVGLGSAGIALAFVVVWLVRPGQADASAVPDVVHVCRETGQLIIAPPQPTPAINPRTGRATLYRALYCRACGRWHAVPPSEAGGGNPLSNLCPRHRQPMSAEGPLEGLDSSALKRAGR
jgi:hypothetical protein